MYWIISFLVIIIDQVCKWYVRYFINGKSSLKILNGIINVVYLQNTGAAFGILKNSRPIFIISTFIIMIGLFYAIFYKKIDNKLFKISCTLIIGGGISNLIDRVFLGYVVDYIKLSFFAPVCNLADYCITVGTLFLIIYIFKYGDNKKLNQ